MIVASTSSLELLAQPILGTKSTHFQLVASIPAKTHLEDFGRFDGHAFCDAVLPRAVQVGLLDSSHLAHPFHNLPSSPHDLSMSVTTRVPNRRPSYERLEPSLEVLLRLLRVDGRQRRRRVPAMSQNNVCSGEWLKTTSYLFSLSWPLLTDQPFLGGIASSAFVDLCW